MRTDKPSGATWPSNRRGPCPFVQVLSSTCGAANQTLGTIDVGATTSYSSWGDIASGVYLPEVLPSSKGVVVTRSESVRVGAQLGGHLYDSSGWTVHAHGGWSWETPYRPEHVYANVRMTTRNASLHWMLTVERRFTPPRSADLTDDNI